VWLPAQVPAPRQELIHPDERTPPRSGVTAVQKTRVLADHYGATWGGAMIWHVTTGQPVVIAEKSEFWAT
jgi:hypothetical protein